MQIEKKDLLWNYAATFLKIAASGLLLPFILRMMPAEMVGIWTVFMTVTAFTTLLDFGFSNSFTRNITYIFSGVKSLKIQGFETVLSGIKKIDYGLLKGVISAMRYFYLRIAIILFLLLVTLGTWYIHTLLQHYKGDPKEVFVAWIVLCSINTYNLYSLYYECLLQGKGLIKKSKQIVIIGYTVYLCIASVLIIAGYGLVAIVSAQAFSVIIIRWLSYRSFFTHEIKQQLKETVSLPKMEALKAIYPNALKIGLTSLGGFMVQQSAIIVGSLYLSLEEIASYGITMQFIAVIAALAGIYTATYMPKIAQLRVSQSKFAIREHYLKGQILMIITFFAGGIALISLGEWFFVYIGSQTRSLPLIIILFLLFLSLIETNLIMAGNVLLSKNEVPFYKASLLSGGSTVLGFLIVFEFTSLGLFTLALVPLIINLAYQAWKWPYEVFKDLKIKVKDYNNVMSYFLGLFKLYIWKI